MSADFVAILVVFSSLIGLAIGWTWGTTAEQKLWLDAICGREKIARSRGE